MAFNKILFLHYVSTSHTDKRVADYLKRMKTAMPKIKVYQDAIKTDIVNLTEIYK